MMRFSTTSFSSFRAAVPSAPPAKSACGTRDSKSACQLIQHAQNTQADWRERTSSGGSGVSPNATCSVYRTCGTLVRSLRRSRRSSAKELSASVWSNGQLVRQGNTSGSARRKGSEAR